MADIEILSKLTYYSTYSGKWAGVGRALHWSEITNNWLNLSNRIVALGGVKPVIIHRVTGPWGPGKDHTMTYDEIDANWHNVNEQISALDGEPMSELNEFDNNCPIPADENNYILDGRLRALEAKRKV